MFIYLYKIYIYIGLGLRLGPELQVWSTLPVQFGVDVICNNQKKIQAKYEFIPNATIEAPICHYK